MSEANIQSVTVLSKTTWTPKLFSFTVSRPDSFKFTAGQFVRLGVNPSRLGYHQRDGHQEGDANAPDEDIFARIRLCRRLMMRCWSFFLL